MKRFTPKELERMILFFNNYLPTSLNSEPICEILEESLSNGYTPLKMNQLFIMHQLEQLFYKNIDEFTTESEHYFYHEYGHLYEAFTKGFYFKSIIIIDRNHKHIFSKKNMLSDIISYKKKKVSPTDKNLKSYSTFYKLLASENDLKIIALGGFKQDFIRGNSPLNILSNFGLLQDTYISSSDASFFYSTKIKKSLKHVFKNFN